MSRIRSVHPGLWTDERFVSVQPLARLFFMGIWNECDDQGIFEWSPLKLKMRLLPADNADAASLLSELEEAGAIMRFNANGKTYGVVRNFTKYQRPKKPNSVHPSSELATAFAAGTSEPVPNQFPTEGEISPQRKEGEKEKEEDPPKPPQKKRGEGKSFLSEDWQLPAVADLPPKARACAEQWTAASYETHGEAFACYWRSERKMKSDWTATWANRVVALHSQVMRDQKFGNAPEEAAAPKAPEEQAQWFDRKAEWFRGIGRDDDAEECKRSAERLRRTASIGELVTRAAPHAAAGGR